MRVNPEGRGPGPSLVARLACAAALLSTKFASVSHAPAVRLESAA
jgi:hypothetical protein